MPEGKPITIEPFPNQLEIKFDGYTVATTQHSLLLIETYAPDIYIPFDDINMQHMIRTDRHTHCPHKGDASYWTAKSNTLAAINTMWAYEKPLPACVAIEGHSSFDFSKIETYVDGKLVRGHLLASPRQSVCTYKGEAIYYHVKVGEQMAKNAVWSYRKPWLDFSIDVGNIAGLLAFYTTAFDRILLDGKPIVMDEHTRATDTHMLASPTIDQTLAANMQPKPA